MNKKTHLENQLKKKLEPGKNISLSEIEKERMSAFLSSYIDFNPVAENKTEKKEKRVRADFFFRLAVPAFVLALFFVSNRIVVAERALPGDSLYALKTTVEQVRGQLSFSPESKARLDASLVERRLFEAQTLAAEGRLSKDTARKIANKVDKHSTSLENSLSALRLKDKNVAALEIDGEHRSNIRVYKNLLSRISAETDDLLALLEEIGEDKNNDLALNHEAALATFSRAVFDDEPVEIESQSEVGIFAHADSEGGEASVSIFSATHANDIEMSQAVEVQAGTASEIRELALEEKTLTIAEASNLSVETLGLFVLTRLETTEALINSVKLDKELQAELRAIIKDAFETYEFGERANKAGDEQGARSSFRHALSVAEDVRAAVRVSGKVSQSEILKSLIDNSHIRSEIKQRIESRIEDRAKEVFERVDKVRENVRIDIGDLKNNLLR